MLDGSGSMWGQIDGITKIEIARSVIDDLLKDFLAEQPLGLTVYGHNRKGDCSDIETLVEPAVNTREAISRAVNTIKPMDKTPLSAAVTQAAEVLKSTEEPATVILISDGKETCDFDPCKVGKKLEESGVDFTAHVIGFDVSDISDRAQLKCLAENTGGKFLTASNANELTEALKTVTVIEPKPISEPLMLHETRFIAVEEGTKLTINADLIWTLSDNKTGEILIEKEPAHSIVKMLASGVYKAKVVRVEDQVTAELVVTIDENSSNLFNLKLPVVLPLATIKAPNTAVIGSTISVEWTGPNEHNDVIDIREVGNEKQPISHTRTSEGSPLDLQMPGKVGKYEIRYMLRSPSKVIASHSIKVEAINATLNAPATANVGSTISVEWTGPNYKHDYIAISKSGSDKFNTVGRVRISKGSPLQLKMPKMPGNYEIRYVLSDGGVAIIGRKSITIQ